jgi:hypothetical protein
MNDDPNTPVVDPKRNWILLAIPICIFFAIIEFQRALDGNHRSWVYVFEWPFFGIFIYYMFWKLSQPTEPYDDRDDPPREID